MKTKFCSLSLSLALAFLIAASATQAESPAVAELLDEYRGAGAGPFSAEAAGRLWTDRGDNDRSCASCHTADLKAAGSHARTGKTIEPLAPSVNPSRLTDSAEIAKWLGRNCKWTFGRTCTAQEKGDFLTYIQTQ